ncbi:MAG: hypothetical protein KDA88_16760 [Planctomycetaceae bacterium]|nr:hypothetical protein [Planctomycetaceae bacterium]MCB9951857.1 hypothetical protein [Planctomycetaceae bacterium]
MAVVFELVADFSEDEDAARRCCKWLEHRIRPVEIDGYTITIHPPLVSGYPYTNPTRFQVSVVPANVGYGVALDETDERIPLTDAQLTRLGAFLYDCLRGAPGYQLALVGWDVDFLLEVDELSTYWAAEIRDGLFRGIIASKSLLKQLPTSEYFVEFDDAHVWIPYTGSKTI